VTRAVCVLLLRIQRLDRSQASRRGAGGLLLPAVASSSGPDPATGSRPGEDAPFACGPLLHQAWLPNLHPPVGRSLSYSSRLLFLVSCRNSLMPVDGSKKRLGEAWWFVWRSFVVQACGAYVLWMWWRGGEGRRWGSEVTGKRGGCVARGRWWGCEWGWRRKGRRGPQGTRGGRRLFSCRSTFRSSDGSVVVLVVSAMKARCGGQGVVSHRMTSVCDVES
jgi:hypothetical protein